MNDPDLVSQCSIDQNEGSDTRFSGRSENSVDEESSSSDDQNSEIPKTYRCKSPQCEGQVFTSENEWHQHLVEHIRLPTVNVHRLSKSEEKKLLSKKRKHSGPKAGPRSKTKKNSCRKSKNEKESLKVRVKKIPTGSDKGVFEVVRPATIFYGPGGIYCSNGLLDEVKEEVIDKGVSSEETPQLPAGQSDRSAELDSPRNEEEGVEEVEEERIDEEEGERSQEEGECAEEAAEEDDSEKEGSASWDLNEEGDRGEADQEAPSRGTSPTPSEVLRPTGLLAPEQLGDDDSCYPNSPPESESSGRMVELNGSGAGVSGSDNDSGHSRSPATFPGAGGGSEDEIQDSSQQNFNWDDIVSDSTENTAVNADNDSGNTGPGAAEVSSELGDSGTAASLVDTERLILNDAGESQGPTPTISVRDLGEFRSANFASNDPGQGETEYMSLERLAESQVCCEVCGERARNRQSLEEHRALAGHYKCTIPECGVVLASAGDMSSHQSSVHGSQTQLPPRQSPPVAAGPGTPPVQQLAQQVQRIPIPQQQAQPGMVPQYPGAVPPPLASVAAYPMVPQSIPPQQQLGMVPQSISPQQQLGMVPQSISPQQQQQMTAPPAAQQFRRGPGYRVPQQAGQPFGPGSPNQQQQPGAVQGVPFQQPGVGPYPGQIQPRPLNTLVAPQQPMQRAPMQVRMAGPQNAMAPQPRGMAPSVRAQKRMGAPQSAGRGAQAKQRRVDVLPVSEVATPGKKSDAKAVANILATRGITVTPAGVTRPGLTVQQVTGGAQPGRARGQPIQPSPAQAPQPVTTLNLNSAISITPTGAANARQQTNSGFVVPHGRSVRTQPQTTNVERPPRPPTVDLTGDGPPTPAGSTRLQMTPLVHRGRGRPSLHRNTCQICDKAFTSPEQLAQHMMVHRNPGKLPFRCNLCNAQYPTQQGLTQHRQTYHKESAAVSMGPALVPGEEMVIPLVDLKQPGVAARLGALGIHHCIPLSGLGNQSNGFFHLPVVSIDGSRTSAASNLRSLGASGVLSIGPIKLVPRVSQ